MSEPFRRVPEGIALDLPDSLRRWLADMARQTSDDAVTMEHPVHRRLLGPIDPSKDHDDPVTELQRQFAVEGSLGVLIATAQEPVLSEEEAEEWIRALQLILAATAARLSITQEDDVIRLNESDTEIVTTLQAGISLLIEALEA
jgi:hypothetical protein